VPGGLPKLARAEQRELPFVSMDPREARVLALLSSPMSAADLCEELGESPGSVATLLLDLTLRGAVEEVAGGLVVRRAHPT
jgi:predicted Rossmann fold nucleotide-binding protein DprA/Smf involved in DNA uptake